MAKKTPASAKKTAPKQSAPSTDALHAPAVDHSNAAHSAAAMLAARSKGTVGAGSHKSESAEFKKMKAGLASPQLSSSSPVSGNPILAKTNKTAGFTQQVGHNQTFGSAAARTGVPRRTSGG